MATLKADPAQYLDSREALVKHNEALVARATAALPEAFGMLPAIPVGVIRMEEFREADSPAAYYYEASDDGSRPAYYYINTYQPHTRPLYNMEALAFHEAVPGHHLQISIAQKLQGLPDIRRHGSHTAYVEGWALYAELVAGELGLYSSPATRVGMYNYQAWRAARLVVDTGMHALGWSREDAVRFMKENVALPEEEIANEIDRYITRPGPRLHARPHGATRSPPRSPRGPRRRLRSARVPRRGPRERRRPHGRAPRARPRVAGHADRGRAWLTPVTSAPARGLERSSRPRWS
jgi:uncharacterized protein (DUF885 family)